MPKNCSADVQAVIAYIDKVFKGTDLKAIDEIKANFNLTALTHLDDVAGARTSRFIWAIDLTILKPRLTVRNNLWDWQALQTDSGPNTAFTRFCDALEVKDGKVAGPGGWGVAHALQAWGRFWKEGYLSNRKSMLSFLAPSQYFHR